MTLGYSYYDIPLQDEIYQVKNAVDYYLQRGEELRTTQNKSDYISWYYRGVFDTTKINAIRFRALFFAMRLQPVLNYIERFKLDYQRPPRILDLGCGFGLESTLMAQTGASVHGVDTTEDMITSARKLQTQYQQLHNVQLTLYFDRANLFRFLPDEPYDAVYSSATMHHIEPADKACAAVANLIKPGGYFFLSDENGLSPIQQLAVQRRIGWTRPRTYWQTDTETGEKFLYGNEDIRPPFIWSRHLQKAGLQTRSVKYCRFVPSVPWSLEKLIGFERRVRNLPIFTQLWAIGFLLTAQRIS